MRDFVLTSESMTRGHPDKLCDQISDAMVDACLASDPEGGIVAECAAASGVLFLALRRRRELAFDPTALARRVIAEAGHADTAFSEHATIMLDLSEAPGLPGPAEARAGGASHMTTAFGHACGHTPEKIPFGIWACHRLAARLDERRAAGALPWLGPDAQAQIAVRFEDRRPVAIEALALTFAAAGAVPEEAALRAALWAEAIAPVFETAAIAPAEDARLALSVAPGPGGPEAHSGLTGRKTAADSYGSFVRHSSSALSGKDPGRIERLAAYAARQAALTVLEAGLAAECEVQLSYAPGDSAPSGVEVDSFGTATISDRKLSKRLASKIDFRIGAIQERLDLWAQPAARGGRFFRDFAVYGHFGRPALDPPWERTPDAERLA